MYSTCLFCNRPLGDNEAIEEFPIGRRLAFDASKGRLWVICRRCDRWNLSPLETRWEAIEACEKRFRETRLRVSTDEIGLARLSEGLELVRIGEPQRPEFAAWRYGDQFGRRRQRAIAYSAAGAAGLGLVVVGGAAAGLSIGGGWYGFIALYNHWKDERTIARVRDEAGDPIRVQGKHLLESRILPTDSGEGWALELAHVQGWDKGSSKKKHMDRLILEGDAAIRIGGQLMARINRRGGKKETVQEAVRQIEASGHPEAYLRDAARVSDRLRQVGAVALEEKRRRKKSKKKYTRKGSLQALPTEMKLALEMATQEQSEREALEGELAVLEAAWQAAEEVASIADNLFVPKSAEEFIRREKKSLSARHVQDV
ncbi:MAG: hypothetical protein V3S56_09575 [Gemmatimonadota bacterium]